jgi:hypothetical protein
MKKICEKFDLLNERQGVIRVPFLVKGKIVVPPEIGKEQIEAAFTDADTDYLKLSDAQVVRERIIDRKTMKYTGEYLYQIMPSVNAKELIEADIEKLVRGPYSLPVKDIPDYLSSIGSFLAENIELIDRVLEMSRLTAELPDIFLEHWFASIPELIDKETARQIIDHELSFWNKPGSEFLEGWVKIPARSEPGMIDAFKKEIFGVADSGTQELSHTFVRAMPTRQLHITAGNTPEALLISALRAILTKSAAVIKMPFGATLTGAMMVLAAAVLPEHPLTQNLSLVYWQGGDESIEKILFQPEAFDRIIVWGSPDAVSSVQSRALYTRTVFFNPRYGVSLIGREAFDTDLEKVAVLGSADSMIYNQKACTSSQIHYIEGTEDQANQYAQILRRVLERWDIMIRQFVSPAAKGQVKRMRRGRYSNLHWSINTRNEDFLSGVLVMPGEFNLADHPMCRLIVVRPVKDLTEVLKYLHSGVSTVGVYPEERRLILRDLICAKGVSNVLPLGQCERTYPGAPQDGMFVLSQLVDWKRSF